MVYNYILCCQCCCWWRHRQYTICWWHNDIIVSMMSRCCTHTRTEWQIKWTHYLFHSLCSLAEIMTAFFFRNRINLDLDRFIKQDCWKRTLCLHWTSVLISTDDRTVFNGVQNRSNTGFHIFPQSRTYVRRLRRNLESDLERRAFHLELI